MEDIDAQARVVRRKFATPPVKLACLSCRASRTRCDGGHPCSSCVNKNNACQYRPSRRGGPRIRKKAAANASSTSPPGRGANSPGTNAASINVTAAKEQLLPAAAQQPVAIQNYIDPGAALGQLPDMPQDSDFIFDSLFQASFSDSVFNDAVFNDVVADLPQEMLAAPPKSGPLVRTYRSDRTLLHAYYCWIHPYVPIFPPPESSTPPVDEPSALSQSRPPYDDDGFEPSTPVALALSAVLALIPSAEDTDPTSTESILFRRKCAQFFAQAAIESVEAESEIPDSATEPSRALESTPPPADRAPFHPRVPTELESIIALCLLSVYEYAQRGNIKKMRSRAGQALMDAMMTYSLHTQTDDDDFFAEAKRRVWWMTYVCATQSSIVSNTPPPLELYGASFTTKFPTLDIDPEAWPLFIEAQQAILTATQFVIELNKVLATQGDMQPIYFKMVELETRIAPLVERAEKWTFSSNLAPPMDQAETCLIRSLRSMARIKLNSARIKVHRYCAFYDYPVFSGRHCDLKSTSGQRGADDAYEPLPWPSCCSSPKSSTASNSMSNGHSNSTGNSTGNSTDNSTGNSTGNSAGTNHCGSNANANGLFKQDGSTKASSTPDSSTFASVSSSALESSPTSTNTTPLQKQQLAQQSLPMIAQTMSQPQPQLLPHQMPQHVYHQQQQQQKQLLPTDVGMGLYPPAEPASVASPPLNVPFSSHYSAKICLRSALNIAVGFDGLPYPNPSGQYGIDVSFLSPTSTIVAPRMLPSFVCCAMQSAYVFLSIYRKTKDLQDDSSSVNATALSSSSSSNAYLLTMVLQLQRGMTSILAALENYSTAFEALRSMRDQIQLSAENLIGLAS